MKLLFQVFIILLFTFIGELISSVLPFSFPGSLIGLVLLFTALCFKIVKVSYVKDISNFLQKYMAFLFVPLCVGMMQYFDIIALHWLEIIILMVVSTVVTMIVTALVAKGGHKHE